MLQKCTYFGATLCIEKGEWGGSDHLDDKNRSVYSVYILPNNNPRSHKLFPLIWTGTHFSAKGEDSCQVEDATVKRGDPGHWVTCKSVFTLEGEVSADATRLVKVVYTHREDDYVEKEFKGFVQETMTLSNLPLLQEVLWAQALRGHISNVTVSALGTKLYSILPDNFTTKDKSSSLLLDFAYIDAKGTWRHLNLKAGQF